MKVYFNPISQLFTTIKIHNEIFAYYTENRNVKNFAFHKMWASQNLNKLFDLDVE